MTHRVISTRNEHGWFAICLDCRWHAVNYTDTDKVIVIWARMHTHAHVTLYCTQSNEQTVGG